MPQPKLNLQDPLKPWAEAAERQFYLLCTQSASAAHAEFWWKVCWFLLCVLLLAVGALMFLLA